MPPELLVCATSPAGAAPRPASRRLMSAPFVGRGGGSLGENLEEGIRGGFPSPLWGEGFPPGARSAATAERVRGCILVLTPLGGLPLTALAKRARVLSPKGRAGSVLRLSGMFAARGNFHTSPLWGGRPAWPVGWGASRKPGYSPHPPRSPRSRSERCCIEKASATPSPSRGGMVPYAALCPPVKLSARAIAEPQQLRRGRDARSARSACPQISR
jgi:hypothetical protein